jgi:hypothetical protein
VYRLGFFDEDSVVLEEVSSVPSPKGVNTLIKRVCGIYSVGQLIFFLLLLLQIYRKLEDRE